MHYMPILGTSCCLQSEPEPRGAWVRVSITRISAESHAGFPRWGDIHMLGSNAFHLRHLNAYAKSSLEYLARKY